MASVNRDIAKILGRTEAANTDNVALGSGSGLTVYATLDDLPTSGLSAGDQAFITSTNRIYVSNGSGWYNVALINATPTLTISPSGAVTLATDGSTPTVITLTGADSDNADANLTYTVESDWSFATIATLSQDSSVFTITPLAEGSATPGSSTLTFKVSDGISFGSGTTQFSLTFGPDWSAGYTELQIYRATSPTQNLNLGSSVDVTPDGNWAAVGAKGQGAISNSPGGIFALKRDGGTGIWSEVAILIGDNIATDRMGNDRTVSISDDGQYMIGGVSNYDLSGGANNGRAHIWERQNAGGTSWSRVDIYGSPANDDNDRFGVSADISGDGNYAIVGANGYDGSGNSITDKGAAYIYVRGSGNNWTQQQLIETNQIYTGQFGFDVALNYDGTKAIIGNPFLPFGSLNSVGAAWIFTRSGTTWSQQAKLMAPTSYENDRTGYSVAISADGNTAVAGSYLFSNGTTSGSEFRTGCAYVYTWNGVTWSSATRLISADAASNDFQGQSVSISPDGNIICVGSYLGDNGAEANSGSAYIWQLVDGTWTEVRKVTASVPGAGDLFGTETALTQDGKYLMVGALNDHGQNDVGPINQGAVYWMEG